MIASQLIGGGPGPDYGTKKSKLEPGIRELTAILLMPTFLPTMRVNVAGNWFKLTDPEHLIFHTNRDGAGPPRPGAATGGPRCVQYPALSRRRPAHTPEQARTTRGDAAHAIQGYPGPL